MYRKKNFISLGMSLVLAAGITVTPVTAADFTDGTVPEFNSDDATEFDVQQETADMRSLHQIQRIAFRTKQVQMKQIQTKKSLQRL